MSQHVKTPFFPAFVRGKHKDYRFEYSLDVVALPRPGDWFWNIEEPYSRHIVADIMWAKGGEIHFGTMEVYEEVWYPIINLKESE